MSQEAETATETPSRGAWSDVGDYFHNYMADFIAAVNSHADGQERKIISLKEQIATLKHENEQLKTSFNKSVNVRIILERKVLRLEEAIRIMAKERENALNDLESSDLSRHIIRESLLDTHDIQIKLHGDLASLEDDMWVMKKKYKAVAEAWVKTTGLRVPSYRTAIEEEEEGPDSRLQDRKRYRQSLRAKAQAQHPEPDEEPLEPIKPNWGEFNPAEFTSSQEEALQEETRKRELSPVRQNKPRQIMRRDSESERALLKLSGKSTGKVFPPPPVLNLGGVVFGGSRPSANFSSPQRPSTTAVASNSGTSHVSDFPNANSPPNPLRTDASTSRVHQPQAQAQSVPLLAEPARVAPATNISNVQPQAPSTTLQYYLDRHEERSRVIEESWEHDAEWVALALKRDAEMRQDKEDLREREIARAVEVQAETGVDLGYGLELPRNHRFRVVRVGEQQSAPLLKDPPPSNEIVIKEEPVDVRLEEYQYTEEPILDEEIEVYEGHLAEFIQGIQRMAQQQYAESECSFDQTPPPTRVANAINNEETIASVVPQEPGSSQSKKSKFGQRDLEDDLDSLSSLTSEESAPASKKRKLNKRHAIDEREFTEEIVEPPKKRNPALASRVRNTKQTATGNKGKKDIEVASERTEDDEIALVEEPKDTEPLRASGRLRKLRQASATTSQGSSRTVNRSRNGTSSRRR